MDAQKLATVVALDIGMARTGVAIANSIAKVARPLQVIDARSDLGIETAKIVKTHDAVAVVLGLPRNLRGEDTEQTRFVRQQAELIRDKISVPLFFSDEALTSVRAEEELRNRKKPFEKSDIDMLAAVYILEDFIANNSEIYEIYENR